MYRHQGRVTAVAILTIVGIACGGDESSGNRGGQKTPKPGPATPPDPSSTAGTSGGDFGNPTMTMAPNVGGPSQAGEDPGPCINLQCQQQTCAGGASTSISGVVFDPAGTNPLYNVAIYVPNEPLLALPTGASCDTCDSLYTGHPIAAALTDSAGRFTLFNAPAGSDIPLVIQIGKWRRQVTVPTVAACTDNPMPDGSLRLPRNRSEGDIPHIAIATGGADTLECLLRRVGVDPAEYAPGPDGDGRIHIYAGSMRVDMNMGMFGGGGGNDGPVPNTSPPAPLASTALWHTPESLMRYDMVLLSCEGEETQAMNQQALHDYADAGGRVFASHFHYSWFNTGPFGAENLATWSTGSNDIGDITGTIVTTLPTGEVFPKGQALLEWLGNVGALQGGVLPIEEARHNADVSPANTPSQPWILAGPGSEAPGATQYFSFNTPINVANDPDAMYCGRVVYSDLHVGAASGDDPNVPVPASCADRTLSPQEAALEFMLFDLSSCLTPDDRPPQPPKVD